MTSHHQSHTIHLSSHHANAMLDHARSGKPEEICGIVARNDAGEITAILPVENAAANKIITYEMEPRSQYKAFMQIERQDWELAGIYHSHPATQAYPSRTDQAKAFDPYDNEALYPDCIYFIISLANDDAPVIRAFLLPDPEAIVELEVVIDA